MFITIEIEPVVKLTCYESRCRFNLIHDRSADMLYCGLKVLTIGEGAKCRQFEPVAEPDDQTTTGNAPVTYTIQ